MQNEQVMPYYYDQETLLIPPPIIFRQDFKGHRDYYSISKDMEYIEEASATTIIDKVMPTPQWLTKWIAEKGVAEATKERNQKAPYGTLMHICLADYLKHRHFDFDTLEARINTYKQAKHITFDTSYWLKNLRHDIYAFHIFALKYDIKPLAVEIMLVSQKLGYGGAIDLVFEGKMGSGVNGAILKRDMEYDHYGNLIADKRVRITGILDFKSGRHGFGAENEAQIHMYKNLWMEFYPHIPIDKLFNWAPGNWDNDTEPDYHFKDQTNSIEQFCIQHYVQVYKMKFKNKNEDQVVHRFEGVIELGKESANLEALTFEQAALQRKKDFAGKTIDKAIIKPESKEIEEEAGAIEDLREKQENPDERKKRTRRKKTESEKAQSPEEPTDSPMIQKNEFKEAIIPETMEEQIIPESADENKATVPDANGESNTIEGIDIEEINSIILESINMFN
jgi:hypothetical protein